MKTAEKYFARRLAVGLLIACVGLLLTVSPGIAQSPIDSTAGATVELLGNRIKEVEASAGLDQATATGLLELYRKALSFAEETRSHEEAEQNYARAREEAPEQARALRTELAALETTSAPPLSGGLQNQPLPELEQQLLIEKANLAALKAKLSELDELLEFQTPNANQAREGLTEAKTRLAVVVDELKVPAREDESAQMTEARRWSLENEAKALSARIQRLDQQLLSQPMRFELLQVQSDKAAFEHKRLSERVGVLQSIVVERRRADAETAGDEARETERKTLGKHPLVQNLAELNTQLSEQLKKLANDLEKVNKEEDDASAQANQIGDNFRTARQKLEIAGLSQALGQVLLEQSNNLPEPAAFRKAKRRREALIVESNLRQIRHQEERGRLRDIAGYVEDLLVDQPITEQARLQGELTELAETRRELIGKAIAADDTYLQTLSELEHAQRQLSETAAAYAAFLDERLLWIRSGEPPSWETLRSIPRTLSLFWSAENWHELGQAFVHPTPFAWILILGASGFTILFWKARVLRAALRRSGSKVGELRHDRFSHTMQAIGWTLALALPWPLLFVTLGLYLQSAGEVTLVLEHGLGDSGVWQGQFVPSMGAAFYFIAFISFNFVAFRMMCRPSGVAVVHFGWSASNTAVLRHEIRRLMFTFVPTGFLLFMTLAYDPPSFGGGFSRICVLILMAAMAFFFGRILAPATGALADYYANNPKRPLALLRYFWFGLGLAVPVVLAVLSTMGYVYTASVFAARLLDTLWLILAIIFIHQLVVRWLLLTERRLAFRAALERHQALRAAREAQTQNGAVGESTPLQLEEPQVDYAALSDDTTKLINTALILFAAFATWGIWAGELAAFRILDDVTLWHYSQVVEGAQKLVPITLTDAILALLIGIVGIIAARRLPALLEIVLLARLNITSGSRYTISTLTRYAIVAAGVILLFNLLGGSWSGIQWLIAALGVGIGFGLQEIVANFISGLILLFERPISPGHVVTVGETEGIVTDIRIRSTTIRTWDQKELVVPNKEFVTGRLLNWTLSDSITRIVIPVGIAYGSDVAHALELIDETAREHERVLDDPPPLVTFDSFGDNALTMILRCFVGSWEHRIPTGSELNLEINRKFEEAGIVIAYPQRDIHLDTAQPLDVRIHRVDTKSSDSNEQSRLHPVSDARPTPTGSA
ncbi:MAG: mechanosensitive ion channel [Gammaproteobacteria bacterium]|nr:mechanosensitive ion channel [Gammaproteobacteria bacterium]